MTEESMNYSKIDELIDYRDAILQSDPFRHL